MEPLVKALQGLNDLDNYENKFKKSKNLNIEK